MCLFLSNSASSTQIPSSSRFFRLIRRSSTEETRDGVTRSARTGPQSRALKARGQTTKASPVRCGDSRAFQLEVVARLRPHLGNCSAISLPDLGACHRASQSRFERLTQIKPPALPGDTYFLDDLAPRLGRSSNSNR